MEDKKDKFVFIAGKQIREPKVLKPCITCEMKDRCVSSPIKCGRYSLWFSGEWHRIQRMFKK